MRRRFGLVAALAIVVAACVGCDPGWVNPVLGSGDGSGSVPGDPPGVAVADVALGSPSSLLDLGARGFLVYDGDACMIVLVAKGHATRFAGTGTCGESGDGGPATSAQISMPIQPLGGGFEADAAGDVYFVSSESAQIRRIDSATGVISTFVDGPDDVVGISAEADGSVTFLGLGTTDDDANPFGYHLGRVDPSGQVTTIARYESATWTTGFARVGPDHYVTFTDENPPDQLRVDFDHGEVRTSALAPLPATFVAEDASPDGSIYGLTVDSDDASVAFAGNRIVRIDPDGSAGIIAGTGHPDPGTRRQLDTGADLDLSAYSVAMTRNGNLLIASGHTVYNLVDPAAAPAILPAS
ncbi:MAG TPA: hypothetical protein VFN21_12820 [Acidimicrobiales bacterium]|nr:hypothetical protein [Acidimicrobiales bacterium]